jgi:sugar-specific transcriptional regulator TrmB
MDLSVLDLTTVEQKVLRLLIEHNSLVAKQVVDRLGHNKKVIYETLDSLMRKGMVSMVQRGRTREYSFAGIEAVRATVQEDKDKFERQQEQKKSY